MFKNPEEVAALLAEKDYIADERLSTVLFLSQALGKPLFLEGEPGVGKTELAVVLAKAMDTEFIRLQCYEGLDAAQSLYEWNYPRQILEIKLQDTCGDRDRLAKTIFSDEFLIKRPILKAITHKGPRPAVLLIDELDRADEEFEAFLLEVLSEYQVTIPEIGTVRSAIRPVVILTSNRTRDVHDALKRRCLYHWIDYPDFDKEYAIVRRRLPALDASLARDVCRFMEKIREGDYLKKPGIAETLDWAAALINLHRESLDPETVEATLGIIFKNQQDIMVFWNGCLGCSGEGFDFLKDVKDNVC